jgi:hypothetical protein
VRVLVALFVVALIGLTVAAVTYRPRMERWLRVKVVEVLEDRLDSDVQLDAISVQPGLITRISGGPLTIRHRRHTKVAPLLRIERFETTLTWRQMLRRPRRVDAVTLTGVAIAIPPSRRPETPSDAELAVDNGQPSTVRQASEDQPATVPADEAGDDSDESAEARTAEAKGPTTKAPGPAKTPAVIIDRVTADAATLVILPRELKKLPRRFVLHKLTVRDISSDRPMGFDAVVENPKPRGRIHTTGTFGPWNAVVPARTPLDARYTFVDADLSTIPGIAGILQAEGTYGGQLERIEAIGTSTTPNFDLDVGGRPLSVKTRFTVVVDGTNGNTYIQPAEALLGEGTPIRVTGGVVKAEDRRGRTVDLAMSIADGRLEEVLALVVNGEPTMKGRIRVDASLLIPPGPEKVVRRMVLEGKFSLAGTRFTSRVLQARIDELSRRAQGKLDDPDITRVVSAFSGRFRMADGVIRFPALSFEVDGARVQLAGRYVVAGQGLNFDGRIQLAAGVSQMVRGRKAWLLRPFDGLFRRDGYTEFPIHIRGTVEKPEFGVDVKQTLGRALLPGR